MPGKRAVPRSGHPDGACAHLADLWAGTAPGGIARRRLPRWARTHQAATQETETPLHTGASGHNHDGFKALAAGGGECRGPNVCRDTPARNLDDRLIFPRFGGHQVRRLPPSLHTRLGSDSQAWSADAADCRTPRCIRRSPAWLRRGWHSADGRPARA